MQAIGYIDSPFREKFATPRQARLNIKDTSRINFTEVFSGADFTRGLEEMSHAWVIFEFHQVNYQSGNLTIRPPRLGGTKRVGILASRTPHRPNRLGLSLIKILNVNIGFIEFSGADMIAGTPVFDIKPYHPTADRPDIYNCGYIDDLPSRKLEVNWTKFKKSVSEVELTDYLKGLIDATLCNDPRPVFHHARDSRKEYGMCLQEFNIKFIIENKECFILKIENKSNIF